MGLWKALKNKSELSSYKTDISLHSVCAESRDHIVQTCNGLGAPKTVALPHPNITSRVFSFPPDLGLQGDVRFQYTWSFVICQRLRTR